MHGWGRARALRGNAVVWGLAVASVALALALVGVFRAYQAATWELIHERDLQVAFLSAARMREELARYGSELAALSRQPEIYGSSARERRIALADAEPQLAVFDGGVALLDHLGRVQASHPANPRLLGNDWSDRSFFRAQVASPGLAISDITEDAPSGKAAVALSVPMTDERGAFAGVLVGFFQVGQTGVSPLYASIVRLRMGQRGHLFVVDGQSQIVYDSEYGPAGGPLAERGPRGLTDLRQAGTLRSQDHSGHDVLVAHAPVPGTAWALVLEDDWDALAAPVLRYRQLMLGLLILGLCVPLGGLAWTAHRRRQDPDWSALGGGQADPATLLHQVLSPDHAPMLPGWSLATHVQPAQWGPRDCTDFRFRPDGCLLIVTYRLPAQIGAAARAMTLLRSCLRSAARHGWGAVEGVIEADALLKGETGLDTGLACLWLCLDPRNGRVTLVDAGYNPPRHVLKDRMEDLPAGGPPLGLPGSEDRDPAWSETSLSLEAGECLVCHSIPVDVLVTRPDGSKDESDLDLACAAIRRRDESAQYRLDDLVAALRGMPSHRQAEQLGYQITVIARSVLPGAEAGA